MVAHAALSVLLWFWRRMRTVCTVLQHWILNLLKCNILKLVKVPSLKSKGVNNLEYTTHEQQLKNTNTNTSNTTVALLILASLEDRRARGDIKFWNLYNHPLIFLNPKTVLCSSWTTLLKKWPQHPPLAPLVWDQDLLLPKSLMSTNRKWVSKGWSCATTTSTSQGSPPGLAGTTIVAGRICPDAPK